MIHKYSSDSQERKIIPFFIAALAISAAFLISSIFKSLSFVPPWWLSLPVDTMGFYGIFYWLFDKVIWKMKWVHVLLITRIPNLSGKWEGTVYPARTSISPTNLPSEVKMEITIKQTWTELLITGKTAQSSSHSVSGYFVVADEKVLSYEYVNDPVPGAAETMHAHRGTAHVALDSTCTRLSGEYYSGRDRQGLGRIVLERHPN